MVALPIGIVKTLFFLRARIPIKPIGDLQVLQAVHTFASGCIVNVEPNGKDTAVGNLNRHGAVHRLVHRPAVQD